MPKYKPVKFNPDGWKYLKELADEVAAERNTKSSIPATILEAAKFFRDNRKK